MTIDRHQVSDIIDAATAGPWREYNRQVLIGDEWVNFDTDADAMFAAAARTGWPAALDECARIRALLAEACREWSHASAPEWTETHSRIAEIRKEGGIK